MVSLKIKEIEQTMPAQYAYIAMDRSAELAA